jgi:hypothetical protein
MAPVPFKKIFDLRFRRSFLRFGILAPSRGQLNSRLQSIKKREVIQF